MPSTVGTSLCDVNLPISQLCKHAQGTSLHLGSLPHRRQSPRSSRGCRKAARPLSSDFSDRKSRRRAGALSAAKPPDSSLHHKSFPAGNHLALFYLTQRHQAFIPFLPTISRIVYRIFPIFLRFITFIITNTSNAIEWTVFKRTA